MSRICNCCGQEIDKSDSFIDTGQTAVHPSQSTCIDALKKALRKSEARSTDQAKPGLPLDGRSLLIVLQEALHLPRSLRRVVVDAQYNSITKVYCEAVGSNNLLSVDWAAGLRDGNAIVIKTGRE